MSQLETVKKQLDNVIHYFINVFAEIVPLLNRRLVQAWENSGFNPKPLVHENNFPRLKFGNWIGGDRDGHPLVTAEVTKNALLQLRLNALLILKKDLVKLSENLSFYITISSLPPLALTRFKALINEIGNDIKPTVASSRNEAFKLFVLLLIHKLPINIGKAQSFELEDKKGSYNSSIQLIEDLNILKNALLQEKYTDLAYYSVNQTIHFVKTFGFHLAELDIRQNSQYYDQAFQQLVQKSDPVHSIKQKWTEKTKKELIEKELHYQVL